MENKRHPPYTAKYDATNDTYYIIDEHGKKRSCSGETVRRYIPMSIITEHLTSNETEGWPTLADMRKVESEKVRTVKPKLLPKLLPCPHCGAGEYTVRGKRNLKIQSQLPDKLNYWIWCKHCGFEHFPTNTKEDAIKYWNKRVPKKIDPVPGIIEHNRIVLKDLIVEHGVDIAELYWKNVFSVYVDTVRGAK